MKLDDPRGQFWRYWYGKNLVTEHESMISVPENFVTWNRDESGDLWNEEALEHLRR